MKIDEAMENNWKGTLNIIKFMLCVHAIMEICSGFLKRD